MKFQFVKDAGWLVVFLLMQVLLLRHLSILGAVPDVILVYLLWIISRRDRTSALLLAAFAGFMQDMLLDLWGLNLLAKTLLTFSIHTFFQRFNETGIEPWQAFLIILGAAFLHNILFLLAGLFADIYAVDAYFWIYLLGSTMYTAIIGSLMFILKDKR